ncbi:MAG: flagellar basal body-associated FliL family protein [Deltaproteobacteria bacterium]|nr:flagellar basal body-associated FliL family protein [Deltaproteobacteria bacterium]
MAQEDELADALDEKEEEAKGKKKGGKKKLIMIALMAIVVLGGGFGAYKFFLAKPDQPAVTEEGQGGPEVEGGQAKGQEAGQAEAVVYPLDPFIVNLGDPAGNRYLKIRVALELASAEVQAEVERKIPQIRDGFLLLLTSKNLAQINTTEGKLKLKSELLHRVNQALTKGRATTLYFTEFVVQ